jgi:hypothetical protein
MFAYTDESGNTGVNIFDEQQPIFWTGTLISPVDLDRVGTLQHTAWCRSLGVKELHAADLRLPRIEKISGELSEFLETHDSRFIFTRIEKRHLAITKFADTLLDSGVNKAVSNIHYANKFFRLAMTLNLSRCFSERSAREFWDIYRAGDSKRFCSLLRRVKENVRHRIRDRRMRTLLLDAICWALLHPAPLLESTRTEMDAPNIVAFSSLMNATHKLAEGSGSKIERFVHDEQNQFARFLKEAFDMLRRVSFNDSSTAWMTDFRLVSDWNCEFEIKASWNSLGLQIVDIVLWLVKRLIDGGPGTLPGDVERLLLYVVRTGSISHFSREQLEYSVAEGAHKVMTLPLSAEQLKRGAELVREFEQRRIQSRDEPPD